MRKYYIAYCKTEDLNIWGIGFTPKKAKEKARALARVDGCSGLSFSSVECSERMYKTLSKSISDWYDKKWWVNNGIAEFDKFLKDDEKEKIASLPVLDAMEISDSDFQEHDLSDKLTILFKLLKSIRENQNNRPTVSCCCRGGGLGP